MGCGRWPRGDLRGHGGERGLRLCGLALLLGASARQGALALLLALVPATGILFPALSASIPKIRAGGSKFTATFLWISGVRTQTVRLDATGTL